MTRFVVALLVVLASTRASTSLAAVVFFIDDATGFNAAVAGLDFEGNEDWESSTLAPNMIDILADPIAPGVANGVFVTGTNPATGLTVQSNTLAGNPTTPSPRGAGGLATASAPFLGTPTDQVSNNSNGDSFDMLFGLTGTSAVSFTPLVFDLNASGNSGAATIRVFDPSNVLLDSAVNVAVAGFTNPTTFFGVVATAGDSIGRVNVFATSAGDLFSGADNINVYTIPEPASLCLWSLLGCAAASTNRRRRKKAEYLAMPSRPAQ